jgi:two-component system, OmpR family, sensor histidine kinase CpxA
MSRLFWKIFLWFLVAMFLVGSTLALSVASSRSAEEGRHIRSFVERVVRAEAEHAARVYETGGPTELQKYLAEMNEDGVATAGMFDASRRDLLKGALDPHLDSLAARALGTYETQFEWSRSSRLLAQRTYGPSGKPYVFYTNAVPPPLGPLPPNLRDLLFRIAMIVAVGVLLCWWLAHYITSPVLRLQAAVREVAAGKLNTRVGSALGGRQDEIGVLGHDFDQMAEHIETLMNVQRRLLQAISHELRSPLARMNVATGIGRQRSGPELQSSWDRIQKETDRLNEMISQLLTLTRLESDTNVAARKTIELSLFLQEIVADADFEARSVERSVILLVSEPLLVTANPVQLRSAVENVLRNAIRYTDCGTQIEVSLLADVNEGKATAIIQVADHGPGVPEPDLANIFRPFYRVADARERDTGGVGLGLAITDHAMRLHGGTASARNSPHNGLIIELRLPSLSHPRTIPSLVAPVEHAPRAQRT